MKAHTEIYPSDFAAQIFKENQLKEVQYVCSGGGTVVQLHAVLDHEYLSKAGFQWFSDNFQLPVFSLSYD